MNLVNEISSLESELQSLRAENAVLKHNKAIIEFENETLCRALTKVQGERDNYMRRAEAIKSLLDATGVNLVTGINKYHELEREMRPERAADAAHDMRQAALADIPDKLREQLDSEQHHDRLAEAEHRLRQKRIDKVTELAEVRQ